MKRVYNFKEILNLSPVVMILLLLSLLPWIMGLMIAIGMVFIGFISIGAFFWLKRSDRKWEMEE